jgi:DNA-binding Xre family transcriptional regulator
MPRSSSHPIYLRLALALVMERLNLTRAKLTHEIGINETTLNNFLDGRNKTKELGTIERYLRNINNLDTELLYVFQKLFPDIHKESTDNFQNIYPIAIRKFLKMDKAHYIPNFDQFAGSYLGYRYAYDEDQITVIWIQIFQPSNDMDIATYRAFQRSAGGAEFWGNGFVVPSRVNITLVGSKSAANIELARLNRIEPPISFLHGIVLTENRHGISLAAKIYCDRISEDSNFDREQYDNILTNMDVTSFRKELEKIGKTEEDVSKILFHIDNQIPHYKNPHKKVLLTNIEPSWKDYEKYKAD